MLGTCYSVALGPGGGKKNPIPAPKESSYPYHREQRGPNRPDAELESGPTWREEGSHWGLMPSGVGMGDTAERSKAGNPRGPRVLPSLVITS